MSRQELTDLPVVDCRARETNGNRPGGKGSRGGEGFEPPRSSLRFRDYWHTISKSVTNAVTVPSGLTVTCSCTVKLWLGTLPWPINTPCKASVTVRVPPAVASICVTVCCTFST